YRSPKDRSCWRSSSRWWRRSSWPRVSTGPACSTVQQCVTGVPTTRSTRRRGSTMKRAAMIVIAIVVFLACPLFAEYTFENKGSWTDSCPKELDGLRKQSRTFEGPLQPLLHYAIPFTKRESFEAAWPHLLKVKSKGTSIVLRRAPNFWLGGDSNAGVCVHT